MTTAFQADAFQTQTLAFQIGATPDVIDVDTHDGGKKRKPWLQKLEYAEDEPLQIPRNRLREAIQQAMLGPQAEEVREELEAFSQPSEAKPFLETLDIPAIAREIGRLVYLRIEIERIEQERLAAEDDEDVLLLIG